MHLIRWLLGLSEVSMKRAYKHALIQRHVLLSTARTSSGSLEAPLDAGDKCDYAFEAISWIYRS